MEQVHAPIVNNFRFNGRVRASQELSVNLPEERMEGRFTVDTTGTDICTALYKFPGDFVIV